MGTSDDDERKLRVIRPSEPPPGHVLKTALIAVGFAATWIILFLLHTRVLIPAVLEARFRFNLAVGVIVGLVGLGALAWLGFVLFRRAAAFYRDPR
ncbi:MAG TPA: hypothetical protein VD929_01865 [Caulobacteraceae bacterium]|nr:hypothetical protein [Caulobacteraceae bacterium]